VALIATTKRRPKTVGESELNVLHNQITSNLFLAALNSRLASLDSRIIYPPLETKSQPVYLLKIFCSEPKDPLDPQVFHQISLIAFLAWVGLGADGLSSSAYGPEEAYLALGEHFFLALPLAVLMAVTVFVISASYSQIIELFPPAAGDIWSAQSF